MPQIPYQNIGDIEKDYRHEPRIVAYHGLVITSSLTLKLYSMMKKDVNNLYRSRKLNQFLECSIKNREIKPYSGIGFAILSEDMLNVLRWYDRHPIVLMNDIYIYRTNGNINNASLADIRELRSFCIWELGIVWYERNAWKTFLASSKSVKDKKIYLDDIMKQGMAMKY